MEHSLNSTNNGSDGSIRHQLGKGSAQTPRRPATLPKKTKMDFQSQLRQCLNRKAPLKARRYPNYQSCLTECVKYYSHGERFAKCFKGYPKPSPRVWRKCVQEALLIMERDATALTCMRRYEIILAKRGRATVATCMAALALMDMSLEEEIPEAIIVAEVMRYLDQDDIFENPFYLLSRAEKKGVQINIIDSLVGKS